MSIKQKPDLAAALADVTGGTRSRNTPLRVSKPVAVRDKGTQAKTGEGRESAPASQPSRQGTAPITGHFPKQVRDQLKILAVEQSTTLSNLMAEAYNDLFAKYGKPEMVPHQNN